MRCKGRSEVPAARLFGLAMLWLGGCESVLGLRELRFEDMQAGSDAATHDDGGSDCALGPDLGDAGPESDVRYEAGDAANEGESGDVP
jgi:hypothetical protein